QVERVRAERVPDITLGAAYRRLEHDQENSFDISAGIDLPIFDRKRGALQEAEALVGAAQASRQSEGLSLLQALDAALLDLERSSRRVAVFDGDLLPKALRALDIAETAYREGATAVLEVLVARRTLAEARLGRLQALRETSEAWAQVQ